MIATLVIGAAVMQALGMTLKMPTLIEANDISRWCTVWSLLERGTYVIDDCPWQKLTQDKVYDFNPWERSTPQGNRTRHFYSTKPPLLPTLLAGFIYPFRAISGIPLDTESLQQRTARKSLLKPELPPGPGNLKTETPEPYKWPVHVLYLKPILILFNVAPLLAFLVLYARLLDRFATNDWAWCVSLFAAAWGSQLFIFSQTLNNHTIAAYSGFFATYALLKILYEQKTGPGYFMAAGFFGAFCACNELPAALFGVLLFVILAIREPRRTLGYFVPAAGVVCAAFLASQYIVGGSFMPKYKEFGTKSYEYEGSYWQTPLEMDALREPKWLYLFHMTFGHHGVFSLTPIFLFSAWGGVRQFLDKSALSRLRSACHGAHARHACVLRLYDKQLRRVDSRPRLDVLAFPVLADPLAAGPGPRGIPMQCVTPRWRACSYRSSRWVTARGSLGVIPGSSTRSSI